MKRNSSLRLVTAFAIAGLLGACGPADTPEEIPAAPSIVTPSGGSTSAAASVLQTASLTSDDEDLSPKIDLPQGSVIFQIVNQNLDIDQIEEQIIAYRLKDVSGTDVRLLVADYDAIQDAYFPAWDTTVDITNAQSFSLSFIDLVGDHIPEIIATGTDAETGEQLMRVYRKSLNAKGFGLYFSLISSLSVRGSILITEIERDQAYYNGQKNGKSFPIVTHEQDKGSENLSDLIKTTYYWRVPGQRLRRGTYGEGLRRENRG